MMRKCEIAWGKKSGPSPIQLACRLAKRPDSKGMFVIRVGDHACVKGWGQHCVLFLLPRLLTVAVEDTLDELLFPFSIRLLPAHDELDCALDRLLIHLVVLCV